MDKTELLNLITDEDIVNILTNEFDSIKGQETSQYIIFSAVCHNSSSMKLYYYKESKTFHCYSQCSCNYSIFDLIGQVLCLSFSESFKWLCNYKGVKNTRQQFRGFKSRDSENKDLEFLKLHSYKPTQNEIILPTYDDRVLRNFDKAIEESWWQEGINDEEVLDKFEILYNYYDGSVIIPHRSPSGEFVGCIRRSFNEKEVEDGKKYMPLTWGNITYKYPKAWNIYGYYQNKENIKRYEKCIVYEAEKATLHYGSIYKQENNIALSLGGMNMSKYQAKLLIDLHCKEITIALDCQYRQELIDSEEDTEEVRKAKEEFNLYIKKIIKIYNMLKNYTLVSIIMDFKNRLEYRDAPIDKGQEIWEKLYNEREIINDERELEELLIDT